MVAVNLTFDAKLLYFINYIVPSMLNCFPKTLK